MKTLPYVWGDDLQTPIGRTRTRVFLIFWFISRLMAGNKPNFFTYHEESCAGFHFNTFILNLILSRWHKIRPQSVYPPPILSYCHPETRDQLPELLDQSQRLTPNAAQAIHSFTPSHTPIEGLEVMARRRWYNNNKKQRWEHLIPKPGELFSIVGPLGILFVETKRRIRNKEPAMVDSNLHQEKVKLCIWKDWPNLESSPILPQHPYKVPLYTCRLVN